MTKEKASQASQEEVDPRDTHRGQRTAMQKERQQTELQRALEPCGPGAQETGQSPRTRAGGRVPAWGSGSAGQLEETALKPPEKSGWRLLGQRPAWAWGTGPTS